MDIDAAILTRVLNINHFLESVLYIDSLDDWSLAKDLGELLIRIDAEEIMGHVLLARLNSRMKHYFDLWALSRLYSFEGSIWVRASKATFARRKMAIEPHPVGLEDEFVKEKSAQWSTFIRRSRLATAPARFADVVLGVRGFADPLLSAAASGGPFNRNWCPGGPWSD